ncbi:hypothetical protein H0H81_008835 [Sphagnurus paluster]|uniref:Protein OS-9 homolog n=1 Tax=Sphagnurus paluster TaxID=117069 RepID=A0A9P7GW56_9AGAR|nr:hypothetical protein H0H81_008835 [Sphagnurus paluster]
MRLLLAGPLLLIPAHAAAALLHSLPDDTHAFPKFRVTFLNRLPLLNDTAQRWLREGLRGGQLEFLDQPWSDRPQPPSSVKQIDSGDAHDGIDSSQLSYPTNYSLERMKISPTDSYLCLIPKPADHTPPVADDPQADFEFTPSRSWSLLQPLSGTCLYHRQGWFTYSYCHNEEIRQFKEATSSKSTGGHKPPQEDPDWEAYTLGKAPKPGADLTVAEQNAHAANLELARGAGSRYLVQRWGDGTLCDKTGKSREVEVQFHCSMTMTDTILFVKEAKTCSYVLVINTPRLCGEPGFKTRRDTGEEHEIQCREIVDEQPPASTADAHANIPDSDHPIKLPRRKPVLPAPVAPPKVPADKMSAARLKEQEKLRQALDLMLAGKKKDARRVALDELEDAVVFEIVEDFDEMSEEQMHSIDKIKEVLHAAGYDLRTNTDKDAAAKKKANNKNKEQGQGKKNKKQTRGGWHEEL